MDIHTCSECESSFVSFGNLRNHVKKFHPDMINIIAPSPSKQFEYQCKNRKPCNSTSSIQHQHSTSSNNNNTKKKKHQVPENLPNILNKPKKMQCGQQILLDVERKIKPDQTSAKVKSKRERLNRNVSRNVKQFPSVAESKKLLEKIKSENKALKDKYEIVETSLRTPRIKILGVTLNYSEEEYETVLRRHNSIFTDDDDFKITYIKHIESKSTNTLYAECSPKLFHRLVACKKVCLGLQQFAVYEDISVLKCYKCQLYCHKGDNCRQKHVTCRKCAGKHDIKQCQSQNKTCVNCKISNEKYGTNHKIAHEAGHWSCPTFLYFLAIARSRVNYGEP